MSEHDTNPDPGTGSAPAGRKHGGAKGRKTRFAILAALLLGAGFLLGGLGSLAAGAYAFGGHGHSGRHGKGPEHMLERAQEKMSWMLSSVDATPEQESQIDAILKETIERVGSFREEKRGARKELVDELLRSDINRDSLEQLRQRHLAGIDQMSSVVLDGAVRAAEVLTPEQRAELREQMASRHRDKR